MLLKTLQNVYDIDNGRESVNGSSLTIIRKSILRAFQQFLVLVLEDDLKSLGLLLPGWRLELASIPH